MVTESLSTNPPPEDGESPSLDGRRTLNEESVEAGAHPADDFSLVLGGPVYQLLLRTRLVRPPLDRVGPRIAVITGMAWLPLVPLAVLGGRFAGGVQVPFVHDFEVHARLLFALPLMILAELIVHARMRAIVAQFVERQIITGNVRPAFNAVVSSAINLRNSVVTEVSLMLLIAVAGPTVWQGMLALNSDTWYATLNSSGLNLTLSGYWYAFVSVPIFQFVLLRWYYRVFIWCRFLFQTSRLDLNLVPIHPDRCCGLGFLGNVAFAFSPLLMAHSGLVAGFIANRILYEGATLPEYKLELVAMLAFLMLIVVGPLCVFAPKLNQARHAGLRTYGRLASDYVISFAKKWTGCAKPEGEPFIGSADIQSLADLDNGFAVVRESRLVPVSAQVVGHVALVAALPLVPLGLTMFSLEELLRRLLAMLF